MIATFRTRSTRIVCFITAVIMTAMAFINPVSADSTAKDEQSRYWTENGIIFYEGGALYCDSGAIGSTVLSGGAVGMMKAQKSLDPKWIPVITSAAAKAGADPIAMASLMFWEHRGFVPYGPNHSGGDSDSIGRGTWQITSSSWPSSAGSYSTGVYDPQIATNVAAQIVVSKGGVPGLSIGSINTGFSKNAKVNTIAAVAKGYNAGGATWREPAVADWKQDGRLWQEGSRGPWFAQKQGIIDDYIVAVTYVYYSIATGASLPNSFNNDDFVKTALAKQDTIAPFKVAATDTSIVDESEQCADNSNNTAENNGNIVATALGLAWHFGGHGKAESQARSSYQDAMPKTHGGDPGDDAWSDCGVFVATVMRYSGADPKYPARGTGNQLPYVRGSDKYDTFDNINNEGQLQPGDIFVFSAGNEGHTYIYTGPFKSPDGKTTYTTAAASWHGHVPEAGHIFFNENGHHFTVARLKVNASAPAAAATGNKTPSAN